MTDIVSLALICTGISLFLVSLTVHWTHKMNARLAAFRHDELGIKSEKEEDDYDGP